MYCHSLFFDGTYKGNPRITSEGGLSFYPRGNRQKDYAWGFGEESNNYVEWLALVKGLEIVNTLGFKDIVVFGDSLLVIRET